MLVELGTIRIFYCVYMYVSCRPQALTQFQAEAAEPYMQRLNDVYLEEMVHNLQAQLKAGDLPALK